MRTNSFPCHLDHPGIVEVVEALDFPVVVADLQDFVLHLIGSGPIGKIWVIFVVLNDAGMV